MTFQDMRFALKAIGVDDKFTEVLIEYSRKNGTDYDKLDDMLVREGYEKVFTDEFYGWADSDEEDVEYEYVQKNHHKPLWDE